MHSTVLRKVHIASDQLAIALLAIALLAIALLIIGSATATLRTDELLFEE